MTEMKGKSAKEKLRKKAKMLKKLGAMDDNYIEDITVPESATGPATLPKPEEPKVDINLGDLSKMKKLKNKRKDKSLTKKKQQKGEKRAESGEVEGEGKECDAEEAISAEEAIDVEEAMSAEEAMDVEER